MAPKHTLFEKGDLKISLVSDPDDPIWQVVYEKYCRSFLIEDERETLESLKSYFLKNLFNNSSSSRDSLLVLTKNNEVVAVYIISWIKASEKYSAGIGTYLFTDQAYRGQGLATLLVEKAEALLLQQAQESQTELMGIFIEVNNPLKMDCQTLELDRQAMDPYQRIAFWKKRGFLKLNFCYEQPALKPQGKAATYLDLYFKPFSSSFKEGVPRELLLVILKTYLFEVNQSSVDSYLERISRDLLDKNMVGLKN